MTERLVRFAQSFFDHLDSLFEAERGADGTPSSTDFLLYDLPRIRDLLADDFEGNTMAVAGVVDLRVLIGAGLLAPTVAVYAYLVTNDKVEVIGLSAGFDWAE
jgi:hypothetical protein